MFELIFNSDFFSMILAPEKLRRKIKKSQQIIGVKSLKQSAKSSPFQFSSKVDHGLFLLIELTKKKNSKPLSLQAVAEQNNLSFFFLQKVANDLRKAGIIESERGKNGGYFLKKHPQKLTVKEILEALEGPIAVVPCLQHGSNKKCSRLSSCSMQNGLWTLNQILIKAFARLTLQQILKPKTIS